MKEIKYKNNSYKPQDLLENACQIIRQASDIVMSYYQGNIEVEIKEDQTPCTIADHSSEKLIISALKKLTPDIPILSEEQVAKGNIPDISGGTFWTVDPLDGTKPFIEKTGGFSILIGLVHEEESILGAIYHPTDASLYAANTVDGIAYKENDITNQRTDLNSPNITSKFNKSAIAIINMNAGDEDKITDFLEKKLLNTTIDEIFKVNALDITLNEKGSLYGFCYIAENKADMHPHLSKSKGDGAPFWDVVPGDALIKAIGGKVTDFQGQPLKYKQSTAHPEQLRLPPFIAISGAQLKEQKNNKQNKKYAR